MAENNKNQNPQPSSETSRRQLNSGEEEKNQNTSNQGQQNNSQKGSEWSNYRTKELSGEEQGGGSEGNATTPGE